MRVYRYLIAAAFTAGICPRLDAQAVLFDSLYRDISAVKAAPAPEIPEAVPAKAPAAAAPETAYEKLIDATVWRPQALSADSADLKEGFSPAGHQGQRNVCSVFAASGLAEYLVWKKEGAKKDFSEEFLYYNAKLNYTGKPELEVYKKEPGLAGYVAVDALRGGVVAEKEWPFSPKLQPHAPVPPLTDPEVGVPPAGIAGKVLGYRFAPVAVRRAEIKDFLVRERRPVVMNLMLYMNNIDGRTGRISDPSAQQRRKCFSGEEECYGHVVLLTGYDAKTREYIFRNSWGANWGGSGFGRISEKYLLENCESCHYLGRLGSMSAPDRAMTVNSAYGWSAELK